MQISLRESPIIYLKSYAQKPELCSPECRFALHHAIAFTVKSPFDTFQTTRTSSVRQKIQSLFPPAIGESCIPFSTSVDQLSAKIDGFCTPSSTLLKEETIIVFINGACAAPLAFALTQTDRLIIEEKLCKELRQLFFDAAKRRGCFCYVSISLPASELDVNIHPDKTEVRPWALAALTHAGALSIGASRLWSAIRYAFALRARTPSRAAIP